MKPTQDKYPFFEANQVLTNAHLNQAVDYLDEQERLTRANLIGIGIVCGLEISVDTTTSTITVTKGCGISSEGYLIVQPSTIILGRYKDYSLPEEKDSGKYAAFLKADKSQYPLSELVEDNENNKVGSTLLTATVLNDQAVLAFLELKKEGLRNCSPNNCDDKGAAITATVRYLLIAKTDLNEIIAKANELPTGQTVADLEAKLLAQLNLPDLRLPRYDVPNSNPTTSKELLTAFHSLFSTTKLATQLADALGKAYEAFKPLVQTIGNPAADFKAKFGFLDSVPTTTTQVQFLQYYYDCFDDLIKAYDEFRWKGLALLCACCPSETLFPRHLMLGLTSGASSSVYRHHFLASSASTYCDERTKEVVLLFRRLVEMIAQFTDTPPLPLILIFRKVGSADPQINITPSKLVDVPLSDKAIPYYYKQSGKPPLFELWNAEKTKHNRANQNLSYRSYEYNPDAPVFVTDALRYDLEAYNFLRIEGHLGKNYQNVMNTLLTLKANYRLPIEVIALRTGVFDNTIAIDLTKEASKFQDLEALYDVTREEILCTLCEGIMFLYDIVIDKLKLGGGTPKRLLLKTYAPNYRYKENTVGAWYEANFARIQAIPYVDVNQNAISDNDILKLYFQLFSNALAEVGVKLNANDPASPYYIYIFSVYYFSKLAETLPASLNELSYPDFENKYQDLLEQIRYLRNDSRIAGLIGLLYHFDQVLFACKLQPIKAIYDEYQRRLRDVKQKLFLSDFLQKHPAIQHKAGVPLGGTFIIVYHDNPAPTVVKPSFNVISTDFNQVVVKQSSARVISDAVTRLQSKQDFVLDSDLQLIISELAKQLPTLSDSIIGGVLKNPLDDILTKTINEFTDGEVIADFYLPYRLNIDGPAVQFVIPAQSTFIASECEQEWIDSIKHINNLTLRDYRFVSKNEVPPANEKEKNRLKDNYIIRIYRYDIQGKSMLPVNQTVDIVIPLTSFKTDKLSAVARELNNKFPSGLVFDTKPDANKIIMRYLQGQQFRIELAGIQGNQIHYAYENANVYRWQHQRWQKLDRAASCDNICHSLGSLYQAESYQWLHENYPPQYPKPAPSPTVKETIQWEALALARARQHQSIDALPIGNLLFTIAQAIHQIDSNARVLLIGSWANGSWVSRRAADHAQEPNWSQFLELRKKVTGKTGYSDIDLLIDSENEITAEMIEVSTGYQINIIRGAQDAQKGLFINRTT